jgi:transposase-like protein
MSNRKQKLARTRRQFTTEEKAALLRRHLVDKVPVADLCDELKLQPSVFYQWLRHAHENLAAALGPPASTNTGPTKAREGAGSEDRVPRRAAREEGQRHRRDLGRVRPTKKRAWGALTGRWVPPRHARRGRRLCPRLVRQDRPAPRTLRRLDWHRSREVLRVAPAVRQGERAQRSRSPRPLAARGREESDHLVSREVPAGGVPAPGLHDDRPGRRRSEPLQRLPRATNTLWSS